MRRGRVIPIGLGALAGTLGFAAPALAGDGSFPESRYGDIGTATFPERTVVGDFNNDGDQDLAIANASDQVTILRGTGGADFAPVPGFTIATPAGGQPLDLAVGNFNNDGEEDLAVGNRATDSVSILLGQAGMGFAEAPGSPHLVGDFPIGVATGDFDGDGDDDVATANSTSDNVSILSSNGNGTFAAAVQVGVGDNPRDVQTGDFNNDGDLDLATANLFSANATILTGAAGLGFAGAAPVPVAANPVALVVGDFNSDNDEDLAFSANQTGAVTIVTGAAGAGFAPADGSPINDPIETADIAIGDFNSDADPDLVTTGPNGDDLWILFGGTGATFASAPGMPISTPNVPRSVAVGDFDADGNQDLVVPSDDSLARIMPGGGQALLAGNLLVNGGFETAGAPLSPLSLPPIPGWERTGEMSVMRYGAQSSHIFLPDRVGAARTGGESYLWGGQSGPTGGVTTAFQTVPLPLSAEEVDAGGSTATLSAMLGGGSIFGDRISATASFLNADGTEVGSTTLGPVTAAERANLSTLLPRSGTAAIPAGSRSVRVTMTATDDDASFSSAFADNVKLTVQGGPVPDPPDPDSDGDGVPDAADACPQLAGATANGCPDVPRKLKLGYDEKSEVFEGRLKPKGPCSAKQKVKVFKAAKGRDPKIGRAKTKRSGKFKLAEKADGNRYYAKAKPVTIAASGNCLAVKSKPKELG